MGRQKRSVATVGFLVSLAVVIFVLVGSEGLRRAEVTVLEEDALPSKFMPRDEEAELPIWLTDYNTHVPLIGVLAALPSADLSPVEDLEAQALMDSLSPGVRAHYEDAHPSREAEYAAFIEEHLRRQYEDRAQD
ncbi:MAG: hypothetical protein DRH23_16745 [Deltaproteobacteria bacterium]|nr:hypothetical protein [Deltaproteobacteria bacterium]MBW2381226.1 hypothetical protein [Deltaproteobacteria bacterium]MBW2548706.1 hypothetical protein [Deltaproteobacteria bacterium]MBW2719200.1 hypothetical protein [Deltaproteobacteria bacterium]RLB42942.1 MAG: hypothetical protein DRH23_16745 [Deltaproteobacteria bacterium]